MAKSKATAAPTAKNDSSGKDSESAGKNVREGGENAPLRNLYLVDGSGYLFRAYHALPPMTRPDGTPINAVYGFCRMLVADLLDKPEVDHVAMILDASEHDLPQRDLRQVQGQPARPAGGPDPAIPADPRGRQGLQHHGLRARGLRGRRPDRDLRAHGVEAGATCTIVSSDKDLMQLIRPGVEMMDPIKKTKLGPEAVMEKFGVTPDKVIDVQALAGDSTDNVPGVPGIGVKTAAQLLNEYGDLETLLARAGEIKQPKRREALQANAELARISKKLVTLRDDVPTPAEPEAFDKKKPDPNVLLPWLEKQGFKSLVTTLHQRAGRGDEPGRARSADRVPAAARPEALIGPGAGRAQNPTSPSPPRTMRCSSDARRSTNGSPKRPRRASGLRFRGRRRSIQHAGLVGLSFALLEGPWGNVNSTRRRAAYLPIGHRATGGEAAGRA